MQLVSTSRRRWLSGWKLFAITIALLVAVIWFDARLTTQAPHIGYCPDSADVIVYASDFARFWGDALKVQQLQRVREDWTRAGAGTGLHLHRLTGIRPTPGRWRLWMGRRFLASTGPEGRGVCTSPGLLLRMLGSVHGWIAPADNDGIRPFGEMHYAWRGGFIIVSEERAYVRAALNAAPIDITENLSPRAVVLESRVSPEIKLEVHAANQFPIFGEIPSAITSRTTPMNLPNSWSRSPMAACSASNWGDIASILSVANNALRHIPEWQDAQEFGSTLLDEWELGDMPSKWDDERLDHCTLALTSVNTRSDTPYPSLALVVRSQLPVTGDHPLRNVLPPDAQPIPYEWGGYPGQLFPMTGPNWAPCLGNRGRDWIATSREPLMRELVTGLGDGSPVEADLTIQIDWQQISAALVSLLTQHESYELFAGKSQNEVRGYITPIAQGLRHLGRTEIVGQNAGDRCTIEGVLARQLSETAS